MVRAACVTLVLALIAAAAQAAPERILSIAPGRARRSGRRGGSANAWTSGYVRGSNGAEVEASDGGLPIVEHEGSRALKIAVNHAPDGSYAVAIAKRGWSRYQLDDYGPDGVLEFDAAGTVGGPAEVQLWDSDIDGAGPDAEQGGTVQLLDYWQPSDEWQHVVVPLGDLTAANADLDLGHLVKIVIAGSTGDAETQLFLTGMRFRTTSPERVYPPVKVDQVGYLPQWRKVAKVSPPAVLPDGASFRVKDARTGRTVQEGTLTLVTEADGPSGDVVHEADFSAVADPGAYVVEVPGVGESVQFAVGPDVYDGLFRDVARFWLFQRCGVELTEEVAGPSAHRACHVFDEAIPDPRGGTRDCRGGWHDAGDMNRYSPWLIQPTFMLLSLYRHYPGKFTDGQLGLPESGNGVPDLLDEIRFGLEWLRKMQIREGDDAGMVYDRVHESGLRQPEDVDFFDRRHRLVDPTDRAACSLVAALAHASIVFGRLPEQKEFADACLADALLSWDYLQARGEPDERHHFAAAALLFDATGREDAHDVVRRLAGDVMEQPLSRVNYGVMDAGLAAYCLSDRPEVDAELQAQLRGYYVRYADAVVEASRSRGYGSPMVPGAAFSWGGNGHCIAKSGAHLLMVNRFAPRDDYVAVARDTLHWLLGRNAVSTCFVTGYGEPALGPIYHSMFGPLGPGLPMPPGYMPGGPT